MAKKTRKQRKRRIDALMEQLKHRGIGKDEIYEEMAEELLESHRHRKAFADAFGTEQMSKAETEDLEEFYEAFCEGTLGGPEDDYPEE